jgi:purine-binding chemotaxis protein CheW
MHSRDVPKQRTTMAKDIQVVGFRVGKEHFGVPIELVHEIVRIMEVTSVPDAPDFIEGVINLRGKIIPVIDLRKRFGEKTITASKKNRILVAEIMGKIVGLVVDAASEVVKIPPSDIEPPPNVFGESEVNYVTGVGKIGNKLIILVDLGKIMQRGDLRRITELAEAKAAGTI